MSLNLKMHLLDLEPFLDRPHHDDSRCECGNVVVVKVHLKTHSVKTYFSDSKKAFLRCHSHHHAGRHRDVSVGTL